MAKYGPLISVFVAIAIYNLYLLKSIIEPLPVPDVLKNQNWGIHDISKYDDTVRPFKIEFGNDMIIDLKTRLKNTRFVKSYENINFEYGFNPIHLKTVVDYWLNNYNFGEREQFFNQYPHFITNIQGLNIHFIHVKSKNEKKLPIKPLLILHGWPGSVIEFYKIIPMLMESEKNFVFELVIPSLPGFGFSQGSSKPGLGPVQIGEIMHNLMKRLGYSKYYIQGGDWGSVIGSSMATFFPDKILGYHSNMPAIATTLSNIKRIMGSLWPTLFVEEKFVNRIYPLSEKFSFFIRESGYFHIQATKPSTLGAALEDSPAGLAAWLLEKFYVSMEKKSMEDIFNKYINELLDNVMLYWVTKSATTAANIYAEHFNNFNIGLHLDRVPTNVPCAVARFPKEIIFYTKFELREKYNNIVQISDFDKGGHFAAFEVPDLLAPDILLAITKFDEFHSIKK